MIKIRNNAKRLSISCGEARISQWLPRRRLSPCTEGTCGSVPTLQGLPKGYVAGILTQSTAEVNCLRQWGNTQTHYSYARHT